ncbi:MAG: type II toxin-antitoxin system MqsA family antitoxin [Pseudomonadota bacterium]|nr:type II toxin-antitoxin system MqsA family antitoxin [Pseudomonadota bacterium]
MLHEGMLCPVCDEGYLGLVQEKIEFTYKNHTTEVESNTLNCSVCGESFVISPSERELEKILTDERRKVDGLLTSDEIRTIRLSLGFTQVDFAKTLGVGKKNFARYESGQATQGRSMDNLLRILKERPGMIETLIHAQGKDEITTEITLHISVPMVKKRSQKEVKVISSGDFNFTEGYYDAVGF